MSIIGQGLPVSQILVRGKWVSVTAFTFMERVVNCYITHWTINGQFLWFFDIPHLVPFNGKAPHSIVILNIYSVHYIDEVVGTYHEIGALVYFLPPYSPDHNPIKFCY